MCQGLTPAGELPRACRGWLDTSASPAAAASPSAAEMPPQLPLVLTEMETAATSDATMSASVRPQAARLQLSANANASRCRGKRRKVLVCAPACSGASSGCGCCRCAGNSSAGGAAAASATEVSHGDGGVPAAKGASGAIASGGTAGAGVGVCSVVPAGPAHGMVPGGLPVAASCCCWPAAGGLKAGGDWLHVASPSMIRCPPVMQH